MTANVTYTTNLKLGKPDQGTNTGTWGTLVNAELINMVDEAFGYATQAITDGNNANTTLTMADGTTSVARNIFIEMTGALTFATTNLVVPANKKLYFIYNNTSGGFAVTVKVTGQTGVSVPNGKKIALVCNGTDVVVAENYLAALALGAALPNTSGGTGQASNFTQYGVTYASTTTALATTANGTTGQIFTATTGGAPSWAAPAGQTYPGTGIANSTGSAWGTSYTVSGSGTVVALATSPAITTSITTASTTFTALAGATTLLTLGGTGASAVLAIPGTLEQSTTTGALTVAGGVYIAKKLTAVGATATGALTVTGAITATGTITSNFSDDRLKTKFGNIPDALAKVKSLSGFYYEANETAQALGYKVKREVGVSAQSVQSVMPEVVAPAPIDSQYLTVHYEKLVPLLIEAIKELELKLTLLENK